MALALFASFGGAAGVVRAFDGPNWCVGVLLGTAALGTFAFSIAKISVDWWNSERLDSTHELEGCLQVLLSLIKARYDEQQKSGLRVTIHKPTSNGDEFIQVVEYLGDERGGSCGGRRFPSTAGVIGQCAKEKTTVAGTRGNDVFLDYVDELVRNWGFTREAAKAVNPQTKSWYGVPIINPETDELAAVVYLDSILPGFFDDDAPRQDVGDCCIGIANYVAARYG
ncbi:MAG: hypothetical protein ACRCT8_16995 [Lacipirellulaceae bacterium]